MVPLFHVNTVESTYNHLSHVRSYWLMYRTSGDLISVSASSLATIDGCLTKSNGLWYIRVLSSVIGLSTAGHVVGRQAIVAHDVICPLSRLFDDGEDIVRRNAHRAIEMISENNIGWLVFLCYVNCKLSIFVILHAFFYFYFQCVLGGAAVYLNAENAGLSHELVTVIKVLVSSHNCFCDQKDCFGFIWGGQF